MRIDKIHASNYRTLQNTTIIFRENYCTLSGHNNAGKSCLIRLILNLLYDADTNPWAYDDYIFSYAEDKTQWAKDSSPISIDYELTASRKDDSALVTLLEKLTNRPVENPEIKVNISFVIHSDDRVQTSASVDGNELDEVSRRELLSKLKTSK